MKLGDIEVPDKVIDAIRKLIECLEKRGFHIEHVYLFGSYARGDWLKTSDVDIIMVSKDFKDIPFTKRLDIINEVLFKEGIEPYIEALPYTMEELVEKMKKSIVIASASKYWINLDNIVLNRENNK